MLMPASGFAIVTLRLDYGLEGTSADTDCNGTRGRDDRFERKSNGAAAKPGTNTIRIPNGASHGFSFQANGFTDTDIVKNVNKWKQSSGVYVLVLTDIVGMPVPGRIVRLVDNRLRTAGQATTDADGFYFISYRHRGIPAAYQVRLYAPDGTTIEQTKTVTLTQNSVAEAGFTVVP